MSCECDHSVLEIEFRDVVEHETVRAPCVVEIVGTGPVGPQGPPGTGVGYYTETWKWTTSLVDASASGRVGLNQTTWAATTEVHLNEITTNGRDMALTILALFTQGNKILLQHESDSTRFALYSISGSPVDHGVWWTFPVTVEQSGGVVPANNNNTIVTIFVVGGGGSGGAVWGGITGTLSAQLDLQSALNAKVNRQIAYPTPTTLNQVIACLQAAGLCVP